MRQFRKSAGNVLQNARVTLAFVALTQSFFGPLVQSAKAEDKRQWKRGKDRKKTGASRRSRSVLASVARARRASAGGYRGGSAVAMVPGLAGGVRAGVVGRRCGAHPGGGGRQEEDGAGRCEADPAAEVGGAVSADLGGEGGRAGGAAVAVGPAASGAGADSGQEATAGVGDEAGSAEGTAAVDGGRDASCWRV